MKAGIANKEVGSEFLSLYTTRISTTGNFILKNFLSSAWFRSRHSSINYWACDVASLGLLYICSIFVHLIIKNAHSALNLGLISLRPRTHYDGGIWKRSFISTVRPTVHTFFFTLFVKDNSKMTDDCCVFNSLRRSEDGKYLMLC